MEPKIYTLIGFGVLIIGFIVVPTVFDRLDSMADDSPSNSAWALDDDINLLKSLLSVLAPGAIIIIVVAIWWSRRDIGGGGV